MDVGGTVYDAVFEDEVDEIENETKNVIKEIKDEIDLSEGKA